MLSYWWNAWYGDADIAKWSLQIALDEVGIDARCSRERPDPSR